MAPLSLCNCRNLSSSRSSQPSWANEAIRRPEAPKQATLETGIVVRVPLFIIEGEIVRVSTQTGDVAGRA